MASLQYAQSFKYPLTRGPEYVWHDSMGTLRTPGLVRDSPNVAVRWSVPQCAAVVTMSGCTSVPVHPLSNTVVGHWHVVAVWPPKIGA